MDATRTGLNSRFWNDQFDHSDYLSRPEMTFCELEKHETEKFAFRVPEVWTLAD